MFRCKDTWERIANISIGGTFILIPDENKSLARLSGVNGSSDVIQITCHLFEYLLSPGLLAGCWDSAKINQTTLQLVLSYYGLNSHNNQVR